MNALSLMLNMAKDGLVFLKPLSLILGFVYLVLWTRTVVRLWKGDDALKKCDNNDLARQMGVINRITNHRKRNQMSRKIHGLEIIRSHHKVRQTNEGHFIEL